MIHETRLVALSKLKIKEYTHFVGWSCYDGQMPCLNKLRMPHNISPRIQVHQRRSCQSAVNVAVKKKVMLAKGIV